MFDPISQALLIHVGIKVIDHFWSRVRGGERALADQTGRVGITPMQSGEPKVSHASLQAHQPIPIPRVQIPPPVPSQWPAQWPHETQQPQWEAPATHGWAGQDEYEIVEVKVFLAEAISYLQQEDTVSVAFIVSAENEGSLVAAIDLAEPFEVELLPGAYFFYIIVLDPAAQDLMNSYTFAVGLPVIVNLDDFPNFVVTEMDALLEMTSDDPIYLPSGEGPYGLDMVLLSLDEFLPETADRRLASVLGVSGF
jgi:hypothetical protein